MFLCSWALDLGTGSAIENRVSRHNFCVILISMEKLSEAIEHNYLTEMLENNSPLRQCLKDSMSFYTLGPKAAI